MIFRLSIVTYANFPTVGKNIIPQLNVLFCKKRQLTHPALLPSRIVVIAFFKLSTLSLDLRESLWFKACPRIDLIFGIPKFLDLFSSWCTGRQSCNQQPFRCAKENFGIGIYSKTPSLWAKHMACRLQPEFSVTNRITLEPRCGWFLVQEGFRCQVASAERFRGSSKAWDFWNLRNIIHNTRIHIIHNDHPIPLDAASVKVLQTLLVFY